MNELMVKGAVVSAIALVSPWWLTLAACGWFARQVMVAARGY